MIFLDEKYKDKIKLLYDSFWLTEYRNKWYAFVAWFWDKDSGMHLYKAPDEILQFSNNMNEVWNLQYNWICLFSLIFKKVREWRNSR